MLSFASVWPLRRMLAGPPYPALGTSEGIRERVFPALGVDVERIRSASGMDGTFNVCDFASKECIAVPHTEADLDVLTAGVSLPVFSPAVERDGRKLIDAVWIKDTNVAEALRRGAEELWLVWCIGNHGVYRDGAFQQYVHMIEIAANGALQKELALVRERSTRLHVIRPRVPLPLDPDFFFGRVDASHADRDGLPRRGRLPRRAARGRGRAPTPRPREWSDPVPGVAFRERLRATAWTLRLGWEVDDLEAFIADPSGTVVGDVTHPELGTRRLARSGHFRVDGDGVSRRAQLRASRARAAPPPARPRSRGGADRRRRPVRLARSGPPPWRTLHARGVGSAREGASRDALLALAQKRHGELVLDRRVGARARAAADAEAAHAQALRVGVQAQELLEERRIVPVEELRGEAVEAVLRGRRLQQARSDPRAPRERHRALARGRHVQQLAE